VFFLTSARREKSQYSTTFAIVECADSVVEQYGVEFPLPVGMGISPIDVSGFAVALSFPTR
jgi:hypothetical protein